MQAYSRDPRVQRTRKLLLQAFIDLSDKKDFQDITIKDITTAATVNRATFYRHFQDKYQLLEKALEEVLHINLPSDVLAEKALSQASLLTIFTAVTAFQQSISMRCHQGYEEQIAKIIREQLVVIFQKQIEKSPVPSDGKKISAISSFLSWGIYGASVEWRKSKNEVQPEEFLKPLLPYLMSGLSPQ